MRIPEDKDEPVRNVILPGDVCDSVTGVTAGKWTYMKDGKIYSSILGLTLSNNPDKIIPINGRYIPHINDVIIGRVVDVGGNYWKVDVCGSNYLNLTTSEVPWRVRFDDCARYLQINDAVLLKVKDIRDSEVIVTMKGPGLKRLSGGQIISITPMKVSKVIGKNGSMINRIKKATKCQIVVGRNGLIWLDGTVKGIELASRAIKSIEANWQDSGLTEFIEKYLKHEGGGDRGR